MCVAPPDRAWLLQSVQSGQKDAKIRFLKDTIQEVHIAAKEDVAVLRARHEEHVKMLDARAAAAEAKAISARERAEYLERNAQSLQAELDRAVRRAAPAG